MRVGTHCSIATQCVAACWTIYVVVAAGCGRLGFDSLETSVVDARADGAADATTTPDGALFDAQSPDGTAPDAALDFCLNVTAISRVECEALVAVYSAANGSTWLNNQGWLSSSDPCTWFGVTCAGGVVTQLLLGYNQLSGTIAPEIVGLTNLQYLHMDGSMLTGEIPPDIGALSQLVELEFDGNQLSGSIPKSIGQMTQLVHLSLDRNQLSGMIPIELTALPNLERLHIQRNQLSGALHAEFGNLANLTRFTANVNQLGPDLPASLGSLVQLSELQLADNNFAGEVPASYMNISIPLYPDFSLRDQTGCLTTPDGAFATWLDSRDPSWNSGCP